MLFLEDGRDTKQPRLIMDFDDFPKIRPFNENDYKIGKFRIYRIRRKETTLVSPIRGGEND